MQNLIECLSCLMTNKDYYANCNIKISGERYEQEGMFIYGFILRMSVSI